MRQNPHVRICGGPGSATTLVYLTCDGGRRRAERRSPQTVRYGLLTDDAVVVRIAHVGIGGVIAAHRGDPMPARFSAGNPSIPVVIPARERIVGSWRRRPAP